MYGCAIDNIGGYFAIGCKFGGEAKDKTRYFNRKIELFWNLQEGLKDGDIAIATLGDAEAEVFEEIAAVRYN